MDVFAGDGRRVVYFKNMEKPATDIYTFEKLVKNGFTYIDKTDRLWPLVNKRRLP